ncbi:hypothetical protein [Couchioplanes azureus]|uniref:hypothetical protein n=1 Tax=Couchioplanes caeruleus TaxID=56438 RepID=UPI0016706F22|nr:hypothetical protein [Couchioplanes caeruleus]GGQ88417.1 hypothetical protein GCM10010166_67880 [Couchioplanes caeruleus subsp. azureus]
MAENDVDVDDGDGYLDEATHRWIQEVADRHHGGVWGAAAAAILESAHAAELNPGDPWAGMDARLKRRSGPGPAPA